MKFTVDIDGHTYEGRSLTNNPRGLHVTGPIEFKRPTRGYYRYDEWTDDSGPQGRCTKRHYRWWTAARQLAEQYDDWLDRRENADEALAMVNLFLFLSGVGSPDPIHHSAHHVEAITYWHPRCERCTQFHEFWQLS